MQNPMVEVVLDARAAHQQRCGVNHNAHASPVCHSGTGHRSLRPCQLDTWQVSIGYHASAMRAPRWLLAIWLCFLARAIFYCAALPLWEGYDEWSHFATVQRMAFRGEPLVSRFSQIPRDVAASLELAPVSWECRYLPPPAATYDEFWRLPSVERARREGEFRAIPSAWARQDSTGNLKTYEGLQAPLAGWIMVPVLLAARHAHLSTQVLLLRWFNMAILSLVIPLIFLIARRVFRHDATALACAAIIGAMPGYLIGIARVSNESVAVVLFTALLWLAVEELTRRRLIAMGVVLGLGFLVKAYFLAAVPAVAVLLVSQWRAARPRASLPSRRRKPHRISGASRRLQVAPAAATGAGCPLGLLRCRHPRPRGPRLRGRAPGNFAVKNYIGR